MDLARVERELKKRCAFDYKWSRKQGDDWDKETNFIYSTYSFRALQHYSKHLPEELEQYAWNRWLNFWSAKAIETIFCQHKLVTKERNPYHKFIDFYLASMPFDHKSTVFPKAFSLSVEKAKSNPKQFITWLYNHQSKQQRFHLQNRLFLVFVDETNEDHWKLKAEIALIETTINEYLHSFSINKLHQLKTKRKSIFSDLIWVTG